MLAIPEQGCRFTQWSDGLTNNPRQDVNVTCDINVTAQYVKVWTVVYEADTHGYIAGDVIQEVDDGGAGSEVMAAPNAGYRFLNWSDGVTNNPRRDLNIVSNMSVVAHFVKVWTLQYLSCTGGQIAGVATQIVVTGSNGTWVTAKPDEYYNFDQWSDGLTDNSRRDINVTNNLSVTALFTVDHHNIHHAIMIGIDNYSPSYGATPLLGCSNDVALMKNIMLLNDASNRWDSSNLKTLYDGQATKMAVRTMLQNMAVTTPPGALVFYQQSSHGGSSGGYNTFLCMYDANYTDAELAADLALFHNDVKIVLMIDSCHSGGLFRSVNGQLSWPFAMNVMNNYNTIKRSRLRSTGQPIPKSLGGNIAFMTSANFDQTSWSVSIGETYYGLFSVFMASACFNSTADTNEDGDLQFVEMFNYAAPRASAVNPNQIAQTYNDNLLRKLGFVSSAIPPLIPPTMVSASDGLYLDRVRVEWASSKGATGYQVWKNTWNNTNYATLLISGSPVNPNERYFYYDDTSVLDGFAVYYWLKAFNDVGISGFSSPDSGYLGSAGVLQLSTSETTVSENGGHVALTATRENGSLGAASVAYTTLNGTAIAGLDYTTSSGVFSWEEGSSDPKTIFIPIISRPRNQGHRSFNVKLSNASGAGLGSTSQAAILILDHDPDPVMGPSIRANDQRGTIVISRGDALTVTLTMNASYLAGTLADWWVVAVPHNGQFWYYLNDDFYWMDFPANDLTAIQPAYRGALFNIMEPFTILQSTTTLPVDVYDVYFRVDEYDGILNYPETNWSIMDSVRVIVRE